jgi:hypothetical protein
MIELTEEMITAYRNARTDLNQEQIHGRPPADCDTLTRAGLEAVLAIVERDLLDVPALIRNAYERGQRDERALTALLGPLKGTASDDLPHEHHASCHGPIGELQCGGDKS